MINLPLVFSILGSVYLLLIITYWNAGSYAFLKISTIAWPLGSVISFNFFIFLGLKHLSQSPIYLIATILMGSYALVQLILNNCAPTNILSKQVKKRFGALQLILIAALFDLLFYFFCVDFVGLDHPEIGVLGLTGMVLFGSNLLLIHLRTRNNPIKVIFFQKLVVSFVFISVVLIVLLFMGSISGMLIILNLLFALMVTTTIVVRKSSVPSKSYVLLSDYNLTNRQMQVAKLIMQGLSYGEIADKLSIAENTASKHGSDIFARTKCQDRIAFYAKFFEEYQAEHGEKSIYYTPLKRVQES